MPLAGHRIAGNGQCEEEQPTKIRVFPDPVPHQAPLLL